MFKYLILLSTIICFILIGGIIPLIERKWLSLIQRRVGPKLTGYKGRLQFLSDAIKVLIKNYIILLKKNSIIMVLIPIITLLLNLILLSVLGFSFKNKLIFSKNNTLYLILIEFLNNFLVVLTGLTLFNKYTKLASNRLLNIIFLVEIFILFFYLTIISITNSLSLNNLLTVNWNIIPNPCNVILLSIPTLVYCLITTQKAPFDIVEAETEIIMGHHSEYSGFWFGIFVLIEYLHLFIVVLFLGFFLNQCLTFLIFWKNIFFIKNYFVNSTLILT